MPPQAGQQREGHALRHQQDGGDDAGHQVAGEIVAAVSARPDGDRQVLPEFVRRQAAARASRGFGHQSIIARAAGCARLRA
jgi:hypothetical protein